MNALLDGMRERLEKAKVRLANAQQALQAAQVELQAALAECNIWGSAISLEMREEEKRQAESNEKQIPMDLPELQPAQAADKVAEEPSLSEVINSVNGISINKTEKVREALRAHGSGITPAGIWTEVKDHFSSRAYLYAVLKRLRDSEEVYIRRGKYQLKPKQAEMNLAEPEVVVVQ